LLGFGVEVANNGEEGLKIWRKERHKLILSDLHMPKMSGYDMVERIREEASQLDDINAQPYIIAITANALKGEKERCLNAGMNDYITKPVELNALEKLLDNWRDKNHEESAFATVEEVNKPSAPIDMDKLSQYVNNDKAKQIRFFKMYIEQSGVLVKDINSAVIINDTQSIAQACHQLKSISTTIGAESIAKLAINFEEHCNQQDLTSDELIELRDNLEIEYSRVAQFLKEQVRQSEQESE
jgi:CheY-like chemotaxis protein